MKPRNILLASSTPRRPAEPYTFSRTTSREDPSQPADWRETAGQLAAAVQTLEDLKQRPNKRRTLWKRVIVYSLVMLAVLAAVFLWVL